ncbi:MAG: hypothetical protein ACM33C_03465, partial [Syntrophaceae bacterium]
MKQENEPADSTAEKPASIDFHAPEFNVIDDLNDCAGDYRSFEPLGDIVTADMRHQMERRCNGAHGSLSFESAAPLKGDERFGGGRDAVGPGSPVEMPP